jgi:uncharacterized FlaG/YvyC family protein
MIVELDNGMTVEVEIFDVYRGNNKKTMIIDKEETEDLAKLFTKVQDFLESAELENTNVGMDIHEKCNDWLVKIGK